MGMVFSEYNWIKLRRGLCVLSLGRSELKQALRLVLLTLGENDQAAAVG